MATLTIDDLPDTLHDTLRQDAARHARSLRDEAVERLSRPSEPRRSEPQSAAGHISIAASDCPERSPTVQTPFKGTATLATPVLRAGDPLPPPRTPEEVKALLDSIAALHAGMPKVRHLTAEELREVRDEGRP